MSRPSSLKNSVVISIRFEKDEYEKIQDIAHLESMNTGHNVTASELIRNAVTFVYSDNERLRESFRRSREHVTKRYS